MDEFKDKLHDLIVEHASDLLVKQDDPPPMFPPISHTEERLVDDAARAHGEQVSVPDIPISEIAKVIAWILEMLGVIK